MKERKGIAGLVEGFFGNRPESQKVGRQEQLVKTDPLEEIRVVEVDPAEILIKSISGFADLGPQLQGQLVEYTLVVEKYSGQRDFNLPTLVLGILKYPENASEEARTIADELQVGYDVEVERLKRITTEIEQTVAMREQLAVQGVPLTLLNAADMIGLCVGLEKAERRISSKIPFSSFSSFVSQEDIRRLERRLEGRVEMNKMIDDLRHGAR